VTSAAGSRIERLVEVAPNLFDALVDEASRGYRFMRRLADEWAGRTNRFDRPGEALFAARMTAA